MKGICYLFGIGGLLISGFLIGAGPSYADTPTGGSFSSLAFVPCPSNGKVQSNTAFVSPDRTATVKRVAGPTGDEVWAIDTGDGLMKISVEDWPCPEFLWSPDSKALAVTYSDGGNVGTYHVDIYHVRFDASSKSARIRLNNNQFLFAFPIDITGEATTDFARSYPKCYSPEDPNVAAVSWGDDSTSLVVAEQVLPHSNCDDMGTFSLYELTVPEGKIVRKYSQIDGKHFFAGKLGPELSNADDECFQKQHSCEIPDLHRGDSAQASTGAKPFEKGETVYLVGPPSLIEETSDDKGKYDLKQIYEGNFEISGGVALGWFDEVHVISDSNGLVTFSRSIARHPTNVATAPESAFRRESDFRLMQSWPTPGQYQFCNHLKECFSLSISADARFSITQEMTAESVCELVDEDNKGDCKTSGSIYAAPGYVELRGTGPNDVKDFFVYLASGKLCRIGYSMDFFGCDPGTVNFVPASKK